MLRHFVCWFMVLLLAVSTVGCGGSDVVEDDSAEPTQQEMDEMNEQGQLPSE